MGRIQRAYEARFRSLLRQARARRLEQGLRWLLAKTERVRQAEALSEGRALEQVWQQLRRQLGELRPTRFDSLSRSVEATPGPPRFLCDAGLGGLARWLRAAGYEAIWIPDIDDDALLREARQLGAMILTTDSMLMERRVLRDGLLPAVWVSPTLKTPEQLRTVLDELGLPVRHPRCMKCGGALAPVDKEAVQARIPPRTYQWLDEYFTCQACGKLFWRGTHWQRIQQQLPQR